MVRQVGAPARGKAPKQPELATEANAGDLYSDLQPAYRETLVAPQDDMWAAFADLADHHALIVNGESAGCCSINEKRELLFFYLHTRFEHLAEDFLAYLTRRLELAAAMPSTVDPAFLSVSLDVGHESVATALMFRHVLEPEGVPLTPLRFASTADHLAAIAFVEAATGFPKAFLKPYLAERIDSGELFLHEEQGDILASGECRTDQRRKGYAHLGIIVGRNQRGKGLGTRLMHALVVESRRQGLRPLCSTEPENLPARRVIHRAGFRAHHRVYRVALRSGS